MSGNTDRLAQIEAAASTPRGTFLPMYRDEIRALVEVARAARALDNVLSMQARKNLRAALSALDGSDT